MVAGLAQPGFSRYSTIICVLVRIIAVPARHIKSLMPCRFTGASGLGKSTFVNSLFSADIYQQQLISDNPGTRSGRSDKKHSPETRATA